MLDNFNIDGHKILFFGLIQQKRVRQISLHKTRFMTIVITAYAK